MLYHADTIEALRDWPPLTVDVIFADPPYNIKKTTSKLPKYDKSDSIIKQRWTDFSAAWDAMEDKEYWEFTWNWLAGCRPVLRKHGSIFITGTHHSIPVVDMVLKQQGWYVIQWISWCKPNAFPQRELQQMTSANEVIIWARPNKRYRHHYNVDRARDYMVLDYYRMHGEFPTTPTNLRDFWPINNDGRMAQRYPFLKHGAKKPPELVGRCIDLALPDEPGGVVLDPFFGSGTTGEVVDHLEDWTIQPRTHHPKWHGIELFVEYVRMAELRLNQKLSTAYPGGKSLSDADREKLQAPLGVWAPYILDGRCDDFPSDFLQRCWWKNATQMSNHRLMQWYLKNVKP